MAKVATDKLERFRTQRRNANRHTQRGMGQLEASMRKYGYVTPMTAAADGEIIDGSARAETGATVFGDDVIVVHHDGTKPVIMVRDDIPNADTPQAREISIAANRVAQVNLDFDAEVLLEDLSAGVDLSQFWREDELDGVFADMDKGEIGDAGESNERALGGKARQVKPVLYTDEIALFEQALALTGKRNRGAALIEVCREYVEKHAEGQFNLPA